MARVYVTRPPFERVEMRCVYEDRGYETPCRVFTGYLNPNGYGQISVGSKSDGTNHRMLTHRVMYEHFVGPIPEGVEVDHLCRQPDCCEPSHLELVTHAENMRRGYWGSKTHCANGHAYDDANVYVRTHHSGHTSRTCKTCRREGMRRYHHAKKESA